MAATRPDQVVRVKGFTVEISAPDGGPGEVDAAWESVHGGELIIETTDTTVGGDRFQTCAPGHKSIGEITLRGAMTDKRAALTQWLNDTIAAGPSRRTVTITEIVNAEGGAKGRRSVYFDCFPVSYTFPRLSVTNTAGNVQEEVRIKPVRMELR